MATKKDKKNYMNIAYMVADFPGISETFIVREIIELSKLGFNIAVFALVRPEHFESEQTLCTNELLTQCSYAKPNNILKHIIINIKSIFFHPILYFSSFKIFFPQIVRQGPANYIRILYHFLSGIGFAEQIKKKEIKHIHSHFTTGSNMALAAATFLKISFSFSAHASGDIFVNPILLNEKVARANFVIAVCDYSKKYLDSITDYIYSHKIYRMYNGLTLAEYDNFVANKPLEKEITRSLHDKITIISVGRLVNCKGFHSLIEACRLLKEKGHNIRCEIIGDGPERANLTRLINQWNLNEEVLIKGYLSLSEVYSALEKADIFVLLSEIYLNGYRDGFPTSILEAMIMSLPVISTWISGIPEMVVHGKTGILVHERDSATAAEAIERLILDEKSRKQLGMEGKKRVFESFLLESNIGILAEFMRKSIRRSRE